MCKTGIVQCLMHSKCLTNVSHYNLLSSQQTFETDFIIFPLWRRKRPHRGKWLEYDTILTTSLPLLVPSSLVSFKRKEPFRSACSRARLWFPGKPRNCLQAGGWLSHPGVPKCKWNTVPGSSTRLYGSPHLLPSGSVCRLRAWHWSRCGHILSSSK